MKKQVKSKSAEEPKTRDLAAIQAIHATAVKAGMNASELIEFGLYAILQTYDGKNFQLNDAKNELKRVQMLEGKIPDQLLPSNPLAKFAADAGLSFDELNELALISAIDILNSSEFPDSSPKKQLESYRLKQGQLIPSYRCDRVEVHPFMARLFSGDLKAVHGATFGDLCSDHVGSEHHFLEGSLHRAFAEKNWEESICELINIESVIRHCPALQNEAAAIRALIEAERVLGDFCRAVNAC
jgi:hypothetical protein